MAEKSGEMSVPIVEKVDEVEGGAVGLKTISDLPPEILTKLLKYLLDGNRNAMLSYRLVNSQWKSIIDPLLEAKLSSSFLQPFPEVEMIKGRMDCSELFYVKSPSSISAGNPFPFNSLLLVKGADDEDDDSDNCSTSNEEEDNDSEDEDDNSEVEDDDDSEEEEKDDSQEKAIWFINFVTSFGRNLTTFAIDIPCVEIDFTRLANMLGFMPCLKRLSFSNVALNLPVSARPIPTPPPLPNLAVLELKCAPFPSIPQAFLPYVWLVAVYANQLVRLNLTATDPFQPLLKQHNYYVPFSFSEYFIATTSGDAFVKLKELEIYRPTEDFLLLSGTPALQHFSMTGLAARRYVMLGDLIKFVDRCGDVLQTLFVDVIWNGWAKTRRRGQIWEVDQLEGTAPNLKTLTIRYPTWNNHKTILYQTLVPKCPRLEVLQLIHFGTEPAARMMNPDNVDEVDLQVGSDGDSLERADLKQQLLSLREQESLLQGELEAMLLRELDEVKKRRIAAKEKGVHIRLPLMAGERRLHFQRKEEQAAVRLQMGVNQHEKALRLQRIAALNRNAAIARELREQGI